MIAKMLKAGLGLVGIAGGGIPTGWLIAGAVVAILTVLGGTWKAGYDYRATLDEAAALRLENDRLVASKNEMDRQLTSANRIQQADADRARLLAQRNRELEDAKDVTIQCDPPAAVPDSVRPQPVDKGIRGASPKHSGSATGRGSVRQRPNVTPREAIGGGSESAVECRPGFAC